MTIHHKKDVVLFQLNAIEMRQAMEENSMVFVIYSRLRADLDDAVQGDRWVPNRFPLKICHEEKGRGHILQCRVYLWRYFQEIEAANPLEREIRAEMLTLGISGEADRRMAKHSTKVRK